MRIGRRAAALLLPLLLVVPTMTPASAQDNAPAAPGTIAPSAVNPQTNGNYNQQQLDQLLAPIALYPDKLLMNILMASTYPDQLTEAQAWLQDPAHANLKGDALLDALKPLQWDPSVKAIVQFPQIVDLLTKNPNWTQSIGAAFDNQQDDVLAQVQFLRQQAEKTGNLKSNDKIVVQNQGPDIMIAPAAPDIVYAPYYDPMVVYGPWPWAAYPPVFFPPVYFGIGPLAVGVGWAWGPGWAIAPPLWGWYSVGWGYGGGVFFHAGFGPAFGWYGHGWAGSGWRGGGWRHGGGGHYGFHGYHGHYGFHGGGPGSRAGAAARGYNRGYNRGYRAGAHNGGLNRGGNRAGTVNRGGGRGGNRASTFNRGGGRGGGTHAGTFNRGGFNRGGGGGGHANFRAGGGGRGAGGGRGGGHGGGGGGNRQH